MQLAEEPNDDDLRSAHAFRDALQEDVDRASEGQAKDDSQYARRALIRAFFGQVEGTIAFLKGRVLTKHSSGAGGLDRADLAILHEEAYGLRPNGTAVVQVRFFPLADTFCFVIRSLQRNAGVSDKIFKSCAGWTSFVVAIDIRNRLAHPKCIADLVISDDHLRSVRVAADWVRFTVSATLQRLADHHHRRVVEMTREIERLSGLETREVDTDWRREYEALKAETWSLGERLGIQPDQLRDYLYDSDVTVRNDQFELRL